jgi:hypothetical protein
MGSIRMGLVVGFRTGCFRAFVNFERHSDEDLARQGSFVCQKFLQFEL